MRKDEDSFLANVQGLGTAFQKPVLSDMVTVMYRTALRKVEKVIFENQANAQEFKKRRILSEEKKSSFMVPESI